MIVVGLWAGLSGLWAQTALAADVKVNWQDPSKYTDINPAEQNKDEFERNLFNAFNGMFAALGQKMPDNLHWEITVTDLDLAGEVRQPPAASGQLMRVVRNTDRPAITFSYKLTDAQGQLVKQDTVDLKDPTFMARSPKMIGLRIKPYPYEQYMINRWFEEQQNQKLLPVK